MTNNQITSYCTGCGLCQSVNGTRLKKEINGFTSPILDTEEKYEFCEKICPVNGRHLLIQEPAVWGNYIGIYSGYSMDTEIRFKASSGGITTAVAVYLIENGLVDGIIQAGEDAEDPYTTKTYLSKTREEIVSHCGSRYIISSPLINIHRILSQGGKYAVIGRPCDIVALKNYLDEYPQYKNNVYCTLSFFCAGSPSAKASRRLAERLNFNPDDVTKIRYRGFGWPGKVTVFTDDHEDHMEYIDSWNQIFGRDIRKICKFCADGIGESADIASGDLWNLKDGRPVFDEADGMNVVFSRTEIGQKILDDAMEKGYIHLENYSSKIKELDLVQPHHSTRNKTLYPRILAMKLMGKTVPAYNMNKLKQYCGNESKIRIIRVMLETIKRCLQGRI